MVYIQQEVILKTRQMLLCALFAELTAAGVFVKIPIPGTMLIFTLQTFFVFLSGLLLAPRYALISQLVYMAIGLIGLPVFSKGGGIAYLLEPSFGFIPGFAVCAFLVSLLIRKNMRETQKPLSVLKISAYGLLSIAAMYVIGIVYMYAILNFYLGNPVSIGYVIISATGVFFFIDMANKALALLLGRAVLKSLPAAYRE